MRGNVINLAVGLVIGAAFGKIVTSLVEDVIMPPIGWLIGGVDFSSIALTLREATVTAPAVAVGIGTFINTLIQFTIVAFAIFMVVKMINRTGNPQGGDRAMVRSVRYQTNSLDRRAGAGGDPAAVRAQCHRLGWASPPSLYEM